MAYSNKTQHYELPQYDSNDVPSILTDVNGAYAKIDETMYETAEGVASNTQKVTALETNVELLTDTVAIAQTDANLAKTTADSAHLKIGTMADLKTDVKSSLVGAINELVDGGSTTKYIPLEYYLEGQWRQITSPSNVFNGLAIMGDLAVIKGTFNNLDFPNSPLIAKENGLTLRAIGNVFNLPDSGTTSEILFIPIGRCYNTDRDSGEQTTTNVVIQYHAIDPQNPTYYDGNTYFKVYPESGKVTVIEIYCAFILKESTVVSLTEINSDVVELTNRLNNLEQQNATQRTQIAKLALVNSSNLAKSDFKSMTANVEDSGLKAEINKVDLSTLKE